MMRLIIFFGVLWAGLSVGSLSAPWAEARSSHRYKQPPNSGYYHPGRPGPVRPPSRRPPPRRISWEILGEVQVDKFISSTRSFRLTDRHPIQQIVIIGTRQTVDIQRVEVIYNDGYIENLYELQGHIREGRTQRAYMRGEYVREIRVTSTSPNLLGSRGQYRIEVGR